jgi:metal-dependent amidase/aminoacylase/carboxypeptidase family protein
MFADALTGLGHACGHNLIAMASLSGALATAEIMRTKQLAGTVVLFGTPAEEGKRLTPSYLMLESQSMLTNYFRRWWQDQA